MRMAAANFNRTSMTCRKVVIGPDKSFIVLVIIIIDIIIIIVSNKVVIGPDMSWMVSPFFLYFCKLLFSEETRKRTGKEYLGLFWS